MARTARIRRETTETKVAVAVDLDGGPHPGAHHDPLLRPHAHPDGEARPASACEIDASGDTDIDLHHTVEDVGITLGEALREALGDRAGIRRYGQAGVPMDEALASAHVDLVTRPYLVYNVPRLPGQAGGFDVDLAEQFFRALVTSLQATVHLALRYGSNQHHASRRSSRRSGARSARRRPPTRGSRGRCRPRACSLAAATGQNA